MNLLPPPSSLLPIKVSLISLGCPKNLVDSEIILGNLAKERFQLTSDWKNSDIVIINTCAFLHSAVSEAERYINRAISYKQAGKIKRIIIAGCLPQRYKDELLQKFPKVDGIISIDDINNISTILVGQGFSLANNKRRPEGLPYISCKMNKTPKYLADYAVPRLLTTNHYAYLKIADGCDNFCTYCLIPSIRGRFRSRKIDDVVKEAKQLAQCGVNPAPISTGASSINLNTDIYPAHLENRCGVKELILIAQDTTLYGKDIYHKLSLARLLKQLVKINDIEWLRVLYTHPAHWTDELIDVYTNNSKICKYIDLPLQHISDKILRLMNRPYNRQQVENLLTKLKQIPNLAIRTSFIVGFPEETDKDFEELLGFIKEQKFAHLGCFEYSQEQGTVAYNLPNQIPRRIKKERYDTIMKMQQQISYNRMKSFIGKKVKVIVDNKLSSSVTVSRMAKGLNYIGRTQFDAPEIDGVVYFSTHVILSETKNLKLKPGDFITVKIASAQPYALVTNY